MYIHAYVCIAIYRYDFYMIVVYKNVCIFMIMIMVFTVHKVTTSQPISLLSQQEAHLARLKSFYPVSTLQVSQLYVCNMYIRYRPHDVDIAIYVIFISWYIHSYVASY